MCLLLLLMWCNVKLKSGADCKITRKSEKKTAWGKKQETAQSEPLNMAKVLDHYNPKHVVY